MSMVRSTDLKVIFRSVVRRCRLMRTRPSLVIARKVKVMKMTCATSASLSIPSSHLDPMSGQTESVQKAGDGARRSG